MIAVLPQAIGGSPVTCRISKSILSPATGLISSFDFSLNPYVGCTFACEYCYAAFFVPDEQKEADWGKWVEVKANALDLLSQSKKLGGSRVLVGSVTDSYQPLEQKVGLTRDLLDFISGMLVQPRLVIQTRSPIVTRDIDILRRFDDLQVNMSITTDSDEVRKRFEPKCFSIERRLEAVRELSQAGIRTAVCISPMLPRKDPAQFAQTLSKLGAERYYAAFSTRPEANSPQAPDPTPFESPKR